LRQKPSTSHHCLKEKNIICGKKNDQLSEHINESKLTIIQEGIAFVLDCSGELLSRESWTDQ